MRGEAAEPHRLAVFGRAGLAGDRAADLAGPRARAARGGDLRHGVDDVGGHLFGEGVNNVGHGRVSDVDGVRGDLLDEVRGGPAALRRNGRVAVGHVNDVRRGRAQRVGRINPEPERGLRYAGRDRRSLRRGRSDLEVEPDERGVDRGRGGLAQVDLAVGATAGVAHGEVAQGRIFERAAAVDEGFGGDALLERRDEGERLEVRPALNHRIGRRRKLAGLIVGPAIEGHDGAVAGTDGDQTGIHVLDGAGLGEVLGHRVLSGLLGLGADRRGDPQATAVDVVVGELELGDELLANGGDDVAGRARQRPRRCLGRDGRQRGQRSPVGCGQPPHRHHAVQHIAEAVGEVGLLLGAQGRVIQAGGVHDTGQDRRLGDRELADVLAEVGLGGGFDAIRTAPEIDRVEVALKDLVLGQVAVDLDRDDHLAQLAVQGAVLGEEVVLDILLGDRRPAALDVGASHGLPHRAGDAAWGDPGVGVEVAVLGGDDRLLQVRGDAGQGNRLPVELGNAGHLGLAVVVVDDRGLGIGQAVGNVGDLNSREREDDRAQAEGSRADERPEDPLDPGATRRAPPRPLGGGSAHLGPRERGPGSRTRGVVAHKWVPSGAHSVAVSSPGDGPGESRDGYSSMSAYAAHHRIGQSARAPTLE